MRNGARFISNNENYVIPFTSTARATFPGNVNGPRGRTIEHRTSLLRANEISLVASAGYAGVLCRCHRPIRRNLLSVH